MGVKNTWFKLIRLQTNRFSLSRFHSIKKKLLKTSPNNQAIRHRFVRWTDGSGSYTINAKKIDMDKYCGWNYFKEFLLDREKVFLFSEQVSL